MPSWLFMLLGGRGTLHAEGASQQARALAELSSTQEERVQAGAAGCCRSPNPARTAGCRVPSAGPLGVGRLTTGDRVGRSRAGALVAGHRHGACAQHAAFGAGAAARRAGGLGGAHGPGAVRERSGHRQAGARPGRTIDHVPCGGDRGGGGGGRRLYSVPTARLQGRHDYGTHIAL